jgi:hypothetical protein
MTKGILLPLYYLYLYYLSTTTPTPVPVRVLRKMVDVCTSIYLSRREGERGSVVTAQ